MAESRYEIQSVRRALDLMRALADQGSLTLDQAALVVGSTKSTAFRILETLRVADLVERVPPEGYRPGPEALRWALVMFGRLELPGVAAEETRSLWLSTGETVGLAAITGNTIVLTEILESREPFRMAEVPGTIVSPHSSALGRAIVAHLSDSHLHSVLGEEPYKTITPRSPSTLKELGPLLEVIARKGWAVEVEESALGVACVAAAIFQLGEVRGGISVAAPRVRMTDERLTQLGPVVAGAAQRISRRLSPAGARRPRRP